MISLLAMSLATTFSINGNHIQITDAHITSYGRGFAVKDDTHERVVGHHCTVIYHGSACFDDMGGAIYYHLVSKNPAISDKIRSARWTHGYNLSGTFKKIDVGDDANTYYQVEVDELQ